MVNGLAAQFDLVNEFSGLSPIEYAGRGIRYDLGRNTGLVHVFVDSNNVKNGVTYFYAVTSYDRGDVKAELAPTECQRVVQRDAVTRLFSFDANSAMVTPNGLATGYLPPSLTSNDGYQAVQEVGNATGQVWVEFVDPLQVEEGKKYNVIFENVQVDSATSQVGFCVVSWRA